MAKQKRYNIVDAINEGVAYGRGSDSWKGSLRSWATNYVIPALQGMGLKYWDQVESKHAAQMVRAWEAEGRLSPATIRHIFKALQSAQNYMVEIHGAERKIQISARVLPPLDKKPVRFLTFEQLALCCRVALNPGIRPPKKHGYARSLELGRLTILVCGLAGLRVTEFARLAPSNLNGNELTVAWDCQHDVPVGKNANSVRVIPILPFVADELRSYWARRGSWTKNYNNLGVRSTTVFQWASAIGNDPGIAKVSQRHLRKTLSNELIESVPRHFLEAYGGWAFSGVMLNHYVSLRPRPDDAPHVRAAAVARLREKVLPELEEKLVGLDFGRGVVYSAPAGE